MSISLSKYMNKKNIRVAFRRLVGFRAFCHNGNRKLINGLKANDNVQGDATSNAYFVETW